MRYGGNSGLSEGETRSARLVMAPMMVRQRRLPGPDGCRESPCERCLAPHLDKVGRAVSANEELLFVLPAFPCKSPNPAKVLGGLPDLAEQLALESLDAVMAEISRTHPPGARLVIGSDGRVFGDVLGLADETITAYQRELRAMMDRLPHRRVGLVALDDLPGFAGHTHDRARERLDEDYSEDLDVIRERVRAGTDVGLYRAITRFLFEDGNGPDRRGSRASLQRTARARAYLMMRRSRAWGDLLVERFPDAVRLSIHPQPCGTPKLGVHLAETADAWLTPWHSVAVDLGDRFVLMKRAEAEAEGAEPVNRDGRPSHLALRRSRLDVA